MSVFDEYNGQNNSCAFFFPAILCEKINYWKRGLSAAAAAAISTLFNDFFQSR